MVRKVVIMKHIQVVSAPRVANSRLVILPRKKMMQELIDAIENLDFEDKDFNGDNGNGDEE